MDMPLAADSAWSYADEYREFEKQMELSEKIVAQTAKRKPQTVRLSRVTSKYLLQTLGRQ